MGVRVALGVRIAAGVVGGLALLMVPPTLYWYSGWTAAKGVALCGAMGALFLYVAWRGDSPGWLEGPRRARRRP